jgi:hypothetical protein
MHGAPACLGSHDTPWVGGLEGTSSPPPPHPGLFPGRMTCTDACRRTARAECASAHTALAVRRQGGHV